MRELIKENRSRILVLDYNPEVVYRLKQKNISCIYADIKSPDILENVNIKNIKKVINTVPDFDENMDLISIIKKQNKNIKIFLTANNGDDALELYGKGADYVMVPRFTAGEAIINIIKKDDFSLKHIKENQIKRINDTDRILRED